MGTAVAHPEQARRDVVRQEIHDRKRGVTMGQLEARYEAVLDAVAALKSREIGAVFAERQALVDLAACAELLAAERPAPRALSV